MTVTDRDIYASARMFIDKHGDEALEKAIEKIAAFERRGDIDGRECWNKIAKGIEWMQNPNKQTEETTQ
jgi:hypothetical protein